MDGFRGRKRLWCICVREGELMVMRGVCVCVSVIFMSVLFDI